MQGGLPAYDPQKGGDKFLGSSGGQLTQGQRDVIQASGGAAITVNGVAGGASDSVRDLPFALYPREGMDGGGCGGGLVVVVLLESDPGNTQIPARVSTCCGFGVGGVCR